ncbi:MAG: lectin-like domain-containing protein, partial [Phycisphaerae bacterium]
TFEVGTLPGQLAPGGLIRFIVGDKGGNAERSAPTGGTAGGGGGGTGIVYLRPEIDPEDCSEVLEWELLVAAGGGGGSYQGIFAGACVDGHTGGNGRTGPCGGAPGNNEPACNGEYGDDAAGRGGRGYWASDYGLPYGQGGGCIRISGDSHTGDHGGDGGMGFGGGGSNGIWAPGSYGAGGGGGYAGGRGGAAYHGGAGGGSYVSDWAISFSIQSGNDGRDEGEVLYTCSHLGTVCRSESDCNQNGTADDCDLNGLGRFENFTSNNSNFILNGTASLADQSLRLTTNQNNQNGAIIFEPVTDELIDEFSVEFDFLMGGGSGADGMSFVLIDADDASEGLLPAEGGGDQPLSVSFDTYQSNAANGNHLIVRRYGNEIINEHLAHPLDDSRWQHVLIELIDDKLTIIMTKGLLHQTIVVDQYDIPNFVPIRAGYGFGARTGGATNTHRVDNVRFTIPFDNDCDGNGMPDECQNDSNGNGTPNACEDNDGDGIANHLDQCPGHNDNVDTDGDSIADGCDECPNDNPNDTDGDGVCESVDICQGSDDNADADGDGAPNGCDACPGFDDNLDTDGDDVADGCDFCQGDDAVGDNDADGICDDLDGCPNDSNKIEPGVCGCGVADEDSDGDGTLDCNDGCPFDPNKTEPGVCDCGNEDTDNDNDGVPFCLDCDDSNPNVYPGNTEIICDELDNDCNSTTLDNPGGVCDAQPADISAIGPRYIKVTPAPGNVPVALLITSSFDQCPKYIDFDGGPANGGLGRLVDAPVYYPPGVWGTLNVRGAEIVPGYEYTVHSQLQGSNVAAYATTATHAHGDVDGNGMANFADIQAVVHGFQSTWDGPRGAVDLAPCVPNTIVNFEDIQQAVFAFQNQAFEVACDLPCSGGVATANENEASPSTVTLEFVAHPNSTSEGGTVEVDVWATGPIDLHTFQLSLEATHAKYGEWGPIDAWINDESADFAFAGQSIVTARNVSRGAIGASSLNEPATIGESDSVYLATFKFDIGESHNVAISLADSGNLLLDSYGRSLNVELPDDAIVRTSNPNRQKRERTGSASMRASTR